MVKFVLALVLLLHLCYGHPINKQRMDILKEILKNVLDLTELHRHKKVTIPDLKTMPVPSEEMCKNAAACLGVCVRELKKVLLDKIKVHKNDMYVLDNLEANLKALEPQPENDQECKMTARGNSLTPFSPYITFLREYITL